MKTTLITLSDMRELIDMSPNMNFEKDLETYVLQAQDQELRKFMGDTFYLDFLDDFNASPSLTKYSDLWNGEQYDYGTDKKEHNGLKTILIYHSYARYIGNMGVKSTTTGFVQKTSDWSERVGEKTIARMIQQNRSLAGSNELRVATYLNHNSSDYPLWKCGKKQFVGGYRRIKKIG